MGAFEVRATLRGGKNFIQREPVYKAIATTQPDIVREQMKPAGQAAQPKRFSLMPAKQINLATTAKRFDRANPFARRLDTIELRVLKYFLKNLVCWHTSQRQTLKCLFT